MGLVHDRLLGGTLHTPADRQVADANFAAAPDLGVAARHARTFGYRVRATLLEHDIHQVIDLGAGAPSPLGTCSWRCDGFTAVLTVDADPVITELHRKECLGSCTALQADIRDVDAVLDATATYLDLTEPVGVLATGVLHYLTDDDHPRELLRRYTQELEPGSIMALTHPVTDEGAPDLTHAAKLLADATRLPIQLRTWGEVFWLLPPGMLLLTPLLVPAAAWRPNSPYKLDPANRLVHAAVIRKPRCRPRPSTPPALSIPPPPDPPPADPRPAATTEAART